MTKLEELESAYHAAWAATLDADTAYEAAARDSDGAAFEAANEADEADDVCDAAYEAYQAELNKPKETNQMNRAVRILSQLILILSSLATSYTLLAIGSWDQSPFEPITLVGMTIGVASITQVWYTFKDIMTKEIL